MQRALIHAGRPPSYAHVVIEWTNDCLNHGAGAGFGILDVFLRRCARLISMQTTSTADWGLTASNQYLWEFGGETRFVWRETMHCLESLDHL